METTEKIVEAYCRYVKRFFTLPNIKCDGQLEIDLLAIDIAGREVPERYHIETSISISTGFSKLTAKPFSVEQLRQRVQQAGQRRTIDYFVERKFGSPTVAARLEEYGFRPGNYQKVIVTWGWTVDAEARASSEGILLWDFRRMMKEIAALTSTGRIYFTDDTLRTLQLFEKAVHDLGRAGRDA